jgi:hypothetical protein
VFVKFWVIILINCGNFKGMGSLLLVESLCVFSMMNLFEEKDNKGYLQLIFFLLIMVSLTMFNPSMTVIAFKDKKTLV